MKKTGIKISTNFYNLEMANLKTQKNLQNLLISNPATGRSVSPRTKNSSQINYSELNFNSKEAPPPLRC